MEFKLVKSLLGRRTLLLTLVLTGLLNWSPAAFGQGVKKCQLCAEGRVAALLQPPDPDKNPMNFTDCLSSNPKPMTSHDCHSTSIGCSRVTVTDLDTGKVTSVYKKCGLTGELDQCLQNHAEERFKGNGWECYKISKSANAECGKTTYGTVQGSGNTMMENCICTSGDFCNMEEDPWKYKKLGTTTEMTPTVTEIDGSGHLECGTWTTGFLVVAALSTGFLT